MVIPIRYITYSYWFSIRTGLPPKCLCFTPSYYCWARLVVSRNLTYSCFLVCSMKAQIPTRLKVGKHASERTGKINCTNDVAVLYRTFPVRFGCRASQGKQTSSVHCLFIGLADAIAAFRLGSPEFESSDGQSTFSPRGPLLTVDPFVKNDVYCHFISK